MSINASIAIGDFVGQNQFKYDTFLSVVVVTLK